MNRPSETIPFIPLTRRQTLFWCAYGATLWLAAALLLRWLGPMGVYEGWLQVLLYALIVPGTYPFVLIGQRLSATGNGQIFAAYALATAVAACLDGLALAWTPGLYGGETVLVAGAGAVILWGAGVGVLIALFVNRSGA